MKSTGEATRRLSYDDGQWSLETSELVRLDRNLYRPERRRIDGVDAIFAHLRNKGEGALLNAAERLIRVSELDGSTYEAHDGEWVVSEPSIPPGRPSRSEQLSDDVAELRAEVVLLRAAYSGLAARLKKLERWMAEGPAGKVRFSSPVVLEPAASAPAEAVKAPGGGFAAKAEPVAPPAQAVAFNETLKSAEEPGASEPDAASAPDEPGLPSVELPQLPAVLVCLRQLVGDSVVVELTRDKVPTKPDELALLDASVFVDDEGRERAIVLSNHRATVELGGQLLGVPKQALEEQIDAGIAEPDLVLAMSEIFNNLSGVINREGANPHLKAEALEKTPIDRVPWLSFAKSVLAIGTPTGGKLWIVAR